MRKKENILVLCAHSDDHILGLGGTMARYAEEGKKVQAVIFSYGERSHPWLQRKVTVEMRVKETEEADRELGINKSIFLGLKEGSFEEGIKEKKVDQIIKKMIEKTKPSKIFTHSIDDPHPDHRAVSRHVLSIISESKDPIELFTFGVWNPFNIRRRDSPKLFVDVTRYYGRKIDSLKKFGSQKAAVYPILALDFIKALINGFLKEGRLAEKFYKLK